MMGSNVIVPVIVRRYQKTELSGGLAEKVSQNLAFQIETDEDATIGDVRKQLCDKLQVSEESVNLMMCGRLLSGNTAVSSLLLSPSTAIAAVVDGRSPSTSAKQSANTEKDITSFRVFCKQCCSVQSSKLRVYCSVCGSVFVIVRQDPTCWSDIQSSSVDVDCDDCRKVTKARFGFRCLQCNEEGVPLKNVRMNYDEKACVVCMDNTMKVVADFGCHHFICLECCAAYMRNSLAEGHFILRSDLGYTLECPALHCNKCVSDPHLFYLMGCQNYCDYQRAATEAFVSLSSECIYCSHPECSAAFFVDDDDGDTFLCPECSHVCHRESKEHHKMGEDERLTQRTIEVTCRPCPKCRTPTERNGGCAHMHCLRCDMEWCFVCGKTWGDECQWTHWFD